MAKLIYDEDREHFIAETPDEEDPEGVQWEPEPWPPGDIQVLAQEGDDDQYLVVLEGYEGPLKPNTIYQLTELETEVEEGDGEESDDEPENDDEEDEAEEAPTA